MNNVDEKAMHELLMLAGSIMDKYDAIDRETGRNFNIFDIARIEDKERIVSRLLAELLDPKGRHGQGSAYLRIFLKDCLGMGGGFSEDACANLRVTTERYTDDGRQIDIAIEGSGRFIPIEAKIYAADQDRQCSDYWDYAHTLDKEAKIVYLTLYGGMPSIESRGGLADKNIVPLSFAKDILGWLEQCLALPDTIRKAPIREILVQFISAIKKITNQLEDRPMNEMIQLLSASEANMRNAQAIADSVEICRIQMVNQFFTAFEAKFKGNIERIDTDYDYNKKEDTSVRINYLFERHEGLGLSVIFALESYSGHPALVAGFGMMRHGERVTCSDSAKAKDLRAHYGIDGGKTNAWWICYENITYDGEDVNLANPGGSKENYFRLYDKDMFAKIVDSTVEQAQAVLARLKRS